ncbi:fibronectin type III domain-containing protein [Candidatus Saccharibacteria bacterium]|nr:fibronectin type III domain-containing protein [Candidatus Saccharibacteria bacterium]
MKKTSKINQIKHKKIFKKLKLGNKKAQILLAAVFVVLFAGIGSWFYYHSQAANAASIAMTASSSSVPENSEVTITIRANISSGANFNAVQANFAYDTNKFTYVSTRILGDTANDVLEGPISTDGGHIKIALGYRNNKTGSVDIAAVTFRARAEQASNLGTGLFSFDDDSAVVRYYESQENANVENELGTGPNYRTGTSVSVTDNTPPSTPTNFRSSGVTHNSVTLSWNASTDNAGVAGYRIYRGSTRLNTTLITTTSYTDSNLSASTSYGYSIEAVDINNFVSPRFSPSLSVTTDAAPADTSKPSTPANLRAQVSANRSATLTWNASTDNVGVTGYRIYGRNPGSTLVLLATVSTTSYTDNNLKPGATYTYAVTAIDAAGNESDRASVNTSVPEQNGDVNNGGCVDVYDLATVITNWNRTGSNLTKQQGNLIDTSDEIRQNIKIINIYDLAVVVSNYGKGLCPEQR